MKITIRADEGMWLTDGEIFCKTADLGEGRNANEFTEITEEEYQIILKTQEEQWEIVGA